MKMLTQAEHDELLAARAERDQLRIQVRQADERGDEALRRAHAGEVEIERLKPVVAAALQWWCDRVPMNWDDETLAKAVIQYSGDWPGCDDCDHSECDEPCVPATVAEQLLAVDRHVAHLVHQGRLIAEEGYKPPEGWQVVRFKPRVAANELWREAHGLVKAAKALGLVLTISQRSLHPLAQGNYETVVEVRQVLPR